MSKPADHPEFFRFPAPEGRSRESQIRLDRHGRFWVGAEPVTHPGLQQAFSRWIARHPDDGRLILTNGYDWTYFQADDTPFLVRRVEQRGAALCLHLSDGSIEDLDTRHALRMTPSGALECDVKAGQFSAKFTPQTQAALGPWLAHTPAGYALRWSGGELAIAEAARIG